MFFFLLLNLAEKKRKAEQFYDTGNNFDNFSCFGKFQGSCPDPYCLYSPNNIDLTPAAVVNKSLSKYCVAY